MKTTGSENLQTVGGLFACPDCQHHAQISLSHALPAAAIFAFMPETLPFNLVVDGLSQCSGELCWLGSFQHC